MDPDTTTPDHGPSVGLSFLYGGLILLATLWCWFQWKYRKLLRAASQLPTGIPAFPIIGHGYAVFYGWKRVISVIYEILRNTKERGEKVLCLWLGPFPCIVAIDASDIQTIMNSSVTMEKGEEYNALFTDVNTVAGPIKYCLLSSPVDRWRVTRKHLNSLFLPRNLQQLIPSYNKTSADLVNQIFEHVGRGPVNIFERLKNASLKTIIYLIFGPNLDLDTSKMEFELLGEIPALYGEIQVKRFFLPWLKSEIIHRFVNRESVKIINRVWNNFTETLIKITKERCGENPEEDVDTGANDTINHKESLTILDVFRTLQEKHPDFTEADLRAEILTIYFAGFETIANVLSYCFMALAQHEDIQERAYNEILSIVGCDNDVRLEDLSKLQYLEQILKETMRRFTLIPLVMRRATQDLELSTLTLPAGANVILALRAVHMDPNLYPNPEKFDPERFSPQNSVTRDRFAFVPFSGGPRDCIGKVYAMQLMKVMMVHVLRRYRMRPVQDVYKLKIKYYFSASSIDGFHVALEHRRRL